MPSLQEEILVTLYTGFFYLLNPYELFYGNQQYHVNSIYKAVARLEKIGLLRRMRKEKKTYIKLTEKGKNAVRKHRKAGARLHRNWDEKWRLVIFDVPEKKAQARRYLREYLKSLKFGKVQRSIWITPYDFGRLIDHFSKEMKLTDYIYHMTVTNFRGLNNVTLARTFWDIKAINSKYQDLIKKYSDPFLKLQQKKDNKSQSNLEPGKRFLSSLLWDYQSIAAQDPHLPTQLLPLDWGQTKALDFIERIKKTLKSMN